MIEAASRDGSAAFVLTSSGPGVTPAAQERYAAVTALRAKGVDELGPFLERFDGSVELARAGRPFSEVQRRAASLAPYVPAEEAEWDFWRALVDHDPAPALERLHVPVLALVGEDDRLVPVGESVAVFQPTVAPPLLSLVVFPGADHRLQFGDPPRCRA